MPVDFPVVVAQLALLLLLSQAVDAPSFLPPDTSVATVVGYTETALSSQRSSSLSASDVDLLSCIQAY
jgi:hypothetical protein